MFVPKPTQRVLAVRTIEVHAADVARRVRFDGRVIAAPTALLSMHSVRGGRVSAAGDSFPHVGMKVRRGQLLAVVTPTINAADATTIAATIAEIEQQIATTAQRLRRLTTLAARAAAPEAQVRDLETDLQSLQQRLARVRGQAAATEQLVAEADGVIAAVNVRAGGVVDPNQTVLQILKDGQVWVEARDVAGRDLAAFTGGALAPSAGQNASLASAALASTDLASVGVGSSTPASPTAASAISLTPVAASPMLASGATDQLRHARRRPPGALVQVVASLAETLRGVAIPAAAVTRNASGLPVVYEHTAPEHSTMRVIVGDYADSQTFVALSGVADGVRIVATSAHLLNQIR